jgi:hypothetical protein
MLAFLFARRRRESRLRQKPLPLATHQKHKKDPRGLYFVSASFYERGGGENPQSAPTLTTLVTYALLKVVDCGKNKTEK